MESIHTGLTYTLLGRGSQLGNSKLDSTLYFIGKHTTPARFKDLYKTTNGSPLKRPVKRALWVSFLDAHDITKTTPESEQNDIRDWAYGEQVTDELMTSVLDRYVSEQKHKI